MPNQEKDLDELFQEIPRKYRVLTKLLLKLPNPSIPFFVLKRFPFLEGVFHGLMLPVLMYVFGIVTLWLLVTTTLWVGFPLNVIFTFTLPTIIFTIFLRIQLERTINWWRSEFASPIKWDVSESIEELAAILNEQQRHLQSKKD